MREETNYFVWNIQRRFRDFGNTNEKNSFEISGKTGKKCIARKSSHFLWATAFKKSDFKAV